MAKLDKKVKLMNKILVLVIKMMDRLKKHSMKNNKCDHWIKYMHVKPLKGYVILVVLRCPGFK